MLHKKKYILWWSTADELLPCRLVVWQQILLYHLSDSSRMNMLLLGWVLSFNILWGLCLHLTSMISLMLSRWVQTMFWVVLLRAYCSALLSWATHKPFQCIRFPVRMFSIAAL